MPASEPAATTSLGYLSMIACDTLGWVGGYLIVNLQGRPIEFHCTVPVAPNRAQEILYGATFADTFFGETLGLALVQRGKSKPGCILTTHRPTLAVRDHIPIPVGILDVATSDGAPSDSAPVDSSCLRFGAFTIGTHRRFPDDVEHLDRLLRQIPEAWDLQEPFERIEQAIREAQRAA